MALDIEMKAAFDAGLSPLKEAQAEIKKAQTELQEKLKHLDEQKASGADLTDIGGRLKESQEQLEKLGVARPRTTPIFYRAAASLLTQAPDIQVVGDNSLRANLKLSGGQEITYSRFTLDGIKVSAGDLSSDIHADAEYRAHLIGVMAKRAVAAAA